MNEGLNAVTLVDGQYPTTTPYILAAEKQKTVVAGFITASEGKPQCFWSDVEERDMLHPVYGAFPKLRPGGAVPTKPELLRDVDEELYRNFSRDLAERLRRDKRISYALAALILPLWVAGAVFPDETVGLGLVLGGVAVGVVGSVYDACTRRDPVKEYKRAFARRGIAVAEVRFTSDYYTASGTGESRRDRSTYVVFSATRTPEERRETGSV